MLRYSHFLSNRYIEIKLYSHLTAAKTVKFEAIPSYSSTLVNCDFLLPIHALPLNLTALSIGSVDCLTERVVIDISL